MRDKKEEKGRERRGRGRGREERWGGRKGKRKGVRMIDTKREKEKKNDIIGMCVRQCD